jgi:hypothetical protein
MRAISLIMPTIDWGPTFALCLQAARAALGADDELLVVFDGVPPPPPGWLSASGASLLHTGIRSGPAAARNLAANSARHPILVFVDADVELHRDAIDRIRAHFQADQQLAALFGSYDATPAAPGVVSRFRNLLHHHTHTSNPGPACSFWAGCGAVRRDTFLALGGFDAEAYSQPCIEDIEFGLRLHEASGSILLDPSIAGKHHKRWTLGLMLRTDIQQRAIPWSRLLLGRRQLPATLNLSPSARFSAGISLMLPTLLALASVSSALMPWALLALASCLSLVMLLNHSFLALLRRQGGLLLATAGTGLLILYLLYSSLSFAAVALSTMAAAPVRPPGWLRVRPELQRRLIRTALTLLALLALTAIIKGLVLHGLAQEDTDLHQRFDEWRLFRDRIYPSALLADAEARSLPYFRSTVYLPWALPLFGLLFGAWGMAQGKLIITSTSLAALALIAAIGWRALKPLGRQAGWLGLLTPLAISGNSNSLAHGQFSILCMGLISLQWWLVERRRPVAAGLCWALAMLKPQIALPFALPLLQRRRWVGLIAGSGLLLALSAVALLHTRTGPLPLISGWLRAVPHFIDKGHNNALAAVWPLFEWAGGPALAAGLVLGLGLGLAFPLQRLRRWWRNRSFVERSWHNRPADPLELAGLCGVIGMVAFYHLHYDNIMLFPALLALWRATLIQPRWGNLLLSLAMAFTVWTPQTVLDAIPASRTLQALIWSVGGIWLLLRIARGQTSTLLSLDEATPATAPAGGG